VDQVRSMDVVRLARIPRIGDAIAKNLKDQVTTGKFSKLPRAEVEEQMVEVEKEIKKEESKGSKQRSLLDF